MAAKSAVELGRIQCDVALQQVEAQLCPLPHARCVTPCTAAAMGTGQSWAACKGTGPYAQMYSSAHIIVSDGVVEAGVGAPQPDGLLVVRPSCFLLAVKVPNVYRLATCAHPLLL